MMEFPNLDNFLVEKLYKLRNSTNNNNNNKAESLKRDPLEIALMDTIEAVDAIVEEEKDPERCCEMAREEGNYYFNKKQFKQAIECYNRGIFSGCTNQNIMIILLNNRSLCQYKLGNLGHALNDCFCCLKLDNKHHKSLFRAIKICDHLGKIDDCFFLCHYYHTIYGNTMTSNDMVSHIKDKIVTVMNERKKRISKIKSIIQKKKYLQSILMEKLQERNVTLRGKSALNICGTLDDLSSDEEITDCDSQLDLRYHYYLNIEPLLDKNDGSINLLPKKYLLEESKSLNHFVYYQPKYNTIFWPTIILYPEFKQSDFIQNFRDDSCLYDEMKNILKEPLPWDNKNIYQLNNILFFYENKMNETYIKIPENLILKSILANSRISVIGGTPVFICISKNSSLFTTYECKQESFLF